MTNLPTSFQSTNQANQFIALSNGSASSPAFTFKNAFLHSGIYLSGIYDINIASSASTIATFALTNTTINNKLLLTNGDALTESMKIGNVKFYTNGTSLAVNNNDSCFSYFNTDSFQSFKFLTNAGSRTSCSYGFVTDDDTGMYRSAADNLAFSCGATDILKLSTLLAEVTVNAKITSGVSVSSLALQLGAYNNGLFSRANNEINVVANGVETIRISDSLVQFLVPTNCGITAFPDGTAGSPSVTFVSDLHTGLHYTGGATHQLGISTNSTDRLTIADTSINASQPLVLATQSGLNPELQFASSAVGLYRNTNMLTVRANSSQIVDFNTNVSTFYSRLQLPASSPANCMIYSDDGTWTSGIYMQGSSGEIGFAIAGNKTMYQNTSKIVHNLTTQAIDGTTTNPSYSFLNSTNSGMYRNASGYPAIVSGGVELVYFSNPVVNYTSLIRGQNCSQYAPMYAFQDAQSGIWRDGTTGEIGISVTSTDNFRVNTNKITCNSPVAATAFYFTSEYLQTGIYKSATNELSVICNSLQKLSINQNGTSRLVGHFEVSDGAANLPAYTFTTANTSGLYLYTPSPAEIRMSINSSDVQRWVAGKAVITKDNSSTTPTLVFSSDSKTGFNSWLAGGLNFILAGTERMQMGSTYFIPVYDNTMSAGLAGYAFNNVWSYAFINASDQTLKKDIADCDLGLTFIKTIQPRKYKWKNGNRTHYGFIAQEIQQKCADMKINGTNDSNIGFWKKGGVTPVNDPNIDVKEATTQSLDYTEFISIITKAMQELDDKVNTKMNSINTMFANINTRLTAIENIISLPQSPIVGPI